MIEMNRFLTMDTVVREHEHPTSQSIGDHSTPFIDLTICPDYESAYKDANLKKHGMSRSKYRSGESFSASDNVTEQDLRSLFNFITYDIDEILKRIAFYATERLNPSSSNRWIQIDFNSSNFTKHINIATKYQPHFGRCFSIRPKEHIIKLGVITIDIAARLGIYVYFGYPGQFMSSNTKSKVSEI